ncbi:ribonuclease P protein subunit p25-like protein [Mangifera indica]|uniref:ribonuclease P protein subunit p25-like protein n=1 Tax=Mangifera indica TaxID=29780 RepID=UPI001CF9CEC0|nr:ribonuclease P protein subunit p25-like protein [Mangifera indica]
MDRYQRVEKPKAETPINENEIRITTQGRMRNYITYATTLLQEKGSNEITLKAMGRAINKTVMITELIKRRIVGLHQNTAIGSTDVTDMWEPLEEGLLPLETTRQVSVVTITLSKKELDTSSTGYQLPIPVEQVKPWVENDYDGVNNSNRVFESNGDGGYDGRRYVGRGRGRSRNFRGRGRGYGGGNMRQGSSHYNDYGGGIAPAQGRGRGRGQGRARGRGRIQGFRSDGSIPAAA